MGQYIQIIDGRVNHIVCDDENAEKLRKMGLDIRDISKLRAKPKQDAIVNQDGTYADVEEKKPAIATTESRLKTIEDKLELIAKKVGA